jgi:serine-type D-Ala-D-Ala carboxypeptidase/endopeptidase (penicillin-binding protein 4)
MKLFKSLLFVAILLVAGYGHTENDALYNKIKKLIHSQGGDLNVGIYIRDLKKNKTKFAIHPNRLFIPASTTKLFTSYMALDYLGAEHRFKTVFLADEKADKKGVLNSNLYLKFVGDPTIKYEDLKSIFDNLHINKIKKDIIVDDLIMDNYGTAPGGLTWDDEPFCYAAPKGAIVVDKNCSKAWMEPNSIGKVAKLEIDRPYALRIENTVKTVIPSKLECPYKSKYISDNKYEVYGCMPSNITKPVKLNFALQDTHRMIENYITETLQESNIKFQGKIKFGKATGKTVLYKHESPPLKEILVEVLRDSCNVSASSLFKYIAAKHTGNQGTDEDGELVIKEFLRNTGLSKKSFKFYDGAGESRYNLVSPKTLVELLTKVNASPNLKEIYINALAKYSNPKGTLKYREIKSPYSKYIYAKTGSLENISAIAGLYLPPKGSQYAFAIMINNHNLSYEDVKSLEDKIIYLLLTH